MKNLLTILLALASVSNAATTKFPVTAKWGGDKVVMTDNRTGKTWEEEYFQFFKNCGGKHPNKLGVKVVGTLPKWYAEQERQEKQLEAAGQKAAVETVRLGNTNFQPVSSNSSSSARAVEIANNMVTHWKNYKYEPKHEPEPVKVGLVDGAVSWLLGNTTEDLKLPDEARGAKNSPVLSAEPNSLLPTRPTSITVEEASRHMAMGTEPGYDRVDLLEVEDRAPPSEDLGAAVSLLEAEEAYEKGVGPRPSWLSPVQVKDDVQPVSIDVETFDLAEEVKRFEGFYPNAYWDHNQWSIGHGTRSKKGEGPISKAEAEKRLKDELAKAGNEVLNVAESHGIQLSGVQLAALTSFNYNTGAVKRVFEKSTEENRPVHSVMREWTYAGGRELSGLVKRRKWEAGLYASN